ncbi:MAG: hypothetical protein HPM95_20455 [Alphaproteobacteria bacterium]|nr:hypothetical protein [Alphaproteobacteria bacterium]
MTTEMEGRSPTGCRAWCRGRRVGAIVVLIGRPTHSPWRAAPNRNSARAWADAYGRRVEALLAAARPAHAACLGRPAAA